MSDHKEYAERQEYEKEQATIYDQCKSKEGAYVVFYCKKCCIEIHNNTATIHECIICHSPVLVVSSLSQAKEPAPGAVGGKA